MRVAIMIKDAEYRDALVKKLSSYDNDIFVNIVTNNIKDASGSVILTDIPPADLDDAVLTVLRPRTVFITGSENEYKDGCYTVFKFSSIPVILSELSQVYNKWHGLGPGIDHTAKLITVCCESDSFSSERCRSLAGQIIYSHGGSVLILPLSYINDHGVNEVIRSNSLSRLLYSIQCDREYGLGGVTYTDSYGVSSLLLSKGRNPVAYLDEEELKTLIFGLSKNYDIIIADTASCFREENIMIMKSSDNIVFFERGRRVTGIEETLGKDGLEKFIRVRLTGGTEDAIAMDDCIKKIFGSGDDESIKSRNSKEVRN
ncbi:MAG: hypothetical protein Q4D71_15085 [Oscillospiraceae bacterium]|nr:hypothetical protein [Oscillospiraceae bacterium]